MNLTVLSGHLSRPATRRELPSGDSLLALEVTIPGGDDRPSESVNVVWPGAPAKADQLDTSDEVLVVGRVRRRFFQAGGATASRTEVVAEQVVRPHQTKTVDKALAAARARLDDMPLRR